MDSYQLVRQHSQDIYRADANDQLMQEAIDFVRENFTPEEVYGEDPMILWAKENGFVEKEE